MVIDKIKAVHPEVPVIIYINKSGALLERMATSGVDIVSLDWTVTVPEARQRIGATQPVPIGIGNFSVPLLFCHSFKLRKPTCMTVVPSRFGDKIVGTITLFDITP